MSITNPWPYPGESSRMAAPHFTEAQKIMNRKRMQAMQNDMMRSNPGRYGAFTSTFLPKCSIDKNNDYRYKEGTDGNRPYSYFNTSPWSTNKIKIDIASQYTEPIPGFTYDNDPLPLEGNSLPKSDKYIYDLPWSKVSNNALEAWLPPQPSHTEAWYIDPVEFAAHRYEWRGFFEEASKLRMKFGALSLLHRWILQWYLWSEEQEVSKGKNIIAHVSNWDKPKVKFSQYPEWKTDTNWRGRKLDPSYVDELFHGKESLLEIFDTALDDGKPSVSLPKYEKKGNSNQGANNIYGKAPASIPTYKCSMNDLGSTHIDDLPLQSCILDTERIVPQILKNQVFHSHHLGGLQPLKDSYAWGASTDADDSVAYRKYARWVLQSNLMSDDSEDDDNTDSSITATHHILNRPKRTSTGEQSIGSTSIKNTLSDLFFLGDSESSDYLTSDASVSSEDSEFPIISGEDLEKILEEAKGTVQFHKWQNSPASMHQKEFKNLINLHRFAKESETKNQERWRSREKVEKSRGIKVTAASGAICSPKQPDAMPTGSTLGTVASRNELPIPPKNLKVRRQPIFKENECTYITPDDINFLRELKIKFTQGEFIQRTQLKMEPALSSETTTKNNLKSLETMSLRDTLLTAKPPTGISYRINNEYGNSFLERNREILGRNTEQSQKYHDGPVPKRHYLTAQSGDISFHPGSAGDHPFFQTVKSTFFKKLVISTGRFWNPGAKFSLSGFWVTESLFITALDFHPWAPSTAAKSLQDQIEDFQSRNNSIDIFVSNSYINWLGPSEDQEAIKVTLRAWDTSARLAIFEPEDKKRVTKNFVGIDTLIEEDAAYGYSGVHIATVGYNHLNAARDDPLGLRILVPDHRSVTFGNITISEGLRKSTQSSPVFARLDSGFSHGSYGRMCIVMEGTKDSGSIIGIVSGQCEERSLQWPEALSDFISIFPDGFKAELRRLLRS